MGDGSEERLYRDVRGGAEVPDRCRCPNCGYERPRPVLVPCYALRCPRCEAPLADW
ncbi:hypothetical protein ASZ90_016348 [hydrocarbon metagenome]|uniref:Uncharacterized protein n=1 Tax=hydrocarbon metagenome TaxID=938273 RepID=A0A0W8EYY5_9ZZZZ